MRGSIHVLFDRFLLDEILLFYFPEKCYHELILRSINISD
jgi:hypothetical protein